MKTLFLILICSAALFAQSYPSALFTPAVAKDNVATTFSLAMAIGDTTAFVGSTTGWAANMYAYVCDSSTSTAYCTGTFEIMKVTSVGGSNALNVTRAQSGTSAVAHAAGKLLSNSPIAIYNLTLSQEVLAIETFLGINGANVAQIAGNNAFTGTNTHSNTETFNGALNVAGAQTNTGAVNARSATHTSPAQTGTSASKPATCTAGDQYFATDVTAGQNLFLCTATNTWTQTTTLPAATAALQQLRIKPNVGNITTSEYADPTIVNANAYNYPAQTPGGSLTGGVGASVTLTPCPLGVLGTNTLLRFYISAGTGTAESVASTGAGTCTSGGTTGTVTFTPANSHSGAWTISSSHLGIYEAAAANPFRKVWIPAARYTMRDCLVLPTTGGIWLEGDNYDINFSGGTILDFASVPVNCGGAIQVTAFGGTNTYTIRNLQLWGADSTAIVTSPIAGFAFTGAVRITLSHVATSAFYYGIRTIGAFEVTINEKSDILYSVCNGVQATGLMNLLRITDSYIGYSGRVSGGGCGPGLFLVGDAIPSESTNVLLDGVDVSGSGSAPFSGQVITAAQGMYAQNITGMTVANSYFEANVATQQVLYQGGISSLTEYGNWFNGTGSTYAVQYASDTYAVNSFSNIFYSATGIRSLPTDLSNWVLGPDTCLSSSTECTSHQHYLGHVSKLVTTGALTSFQASNYIATESGSNNAIAGALLDASGTAVPLAAGLLVRVKLAHTLQAGANTFTFNSTSKNIKSHLNVANNIGTAYAATGTATLFYDGTQWQDMSQ